MVLPNTTVLSLHKMSDGINFGIKGLGKDECLEMCCKFIEANPGLAIISVGSGAGRLESWIQERWSRDVTCVDPSPIFGFSINFRLKKPFMKPKYDYVDDLITEKPEYVGNCILLLIWAPPNETYDLEAVRKLQPRAFLTMMSLYKPCIYFTMAGGEKFVKFLLEQRVRREYRCVDEIRKMVVVDSFEVDKKDDDRTKFKWIFDVRFQWWGNMDGFDCVGIGDCMYDVFGEEEKDEEGRNINVLIRNLMRTRKALRDGQFQITDNFIGDDFKIGDLLGDAGLKEFLGTRIELLKLIEKRLELIEMSAPNEFYIKFG